MGAVAEMLSLLAPEMLRARQAFLLGTTAFADARSVGLLASARALLAAGDKAGATTRFETLLVDYPTSALAPQARRELERMKGQVPPAIH